MGELAAKPKTESIAGVESLSSCYRCSYEHMGEILSALEHAAGREKGTEEYESKIERMMDKLLEVEREHLGPKDPELAKEVRSLRKLVEGHLGPKEPEASLAEIEVRIRKIRPELKEKWYEASRRKVESLIEPSNNKSNETMKSGTDLVNEAGRTLRQKKESPEIPSVSAALDPIAKPGADWLGVSPRTISQYIGVPIITGAGYAGLGLFLTRLGEFTAGLLGGVLGTTASATGITKGRAEGDALLFTGVSFAEMIHAITGSSESFFDELAKLQEGIREGDWSKIRDAFIAEGSTSNLADEMERTLGGFTPETEEGGEEGGGEGEGEEEFKEVSRGRFELHEEEEEPPATSPGVGKFQVFQE